MKKIALDIDGVLADAFNFFVSHYNKKNRTCFQLKDYHSPQRNKIFGITKEEMAKAVDDFYDENGCLNINPVEGAVDGAKKLSNFGEIYVITARQDYFREDTLKWVEKHLDRVVKDIYFAKNYYKLNLTSHRLDKSEICVKIGADLVIDDDFDNVFYCGKRGIKSFLFDSFREFDSLHENVSLVRSWKEAVDKAEKLFGL